MLPNDLERAFFHELGHFVSSSLNYELYKIQKILKVTLTEASSKGLFIGAVTTEYPDINLSTFAPIAANNVYGCFFEGIYKWKNRRENLDYYRCFSQYGHGKHDRDLLITLFWKNGLKLNLEEYTEIPENLKTIFDEELIKMHNNSNLLVLFQLNVENYLSQSSNNDYQIDIAKLEKDIREIINNHRNDYVLFIEKIQFAIKS